MRTRTEVEPTSGSDRQRPFVPEPNEEFRDE